MIKFRFRWFFSILGYLGVLGGGILSCAAIGNQVVAASKASMSNDNPDRPIKNTYQILIYKLNF